MSTTTTTTNATHRRLDAGAAIAEARRLGADVDSDGWRPLLLRLAELLGEARRCDLARNGLLWELRRLLAPLPHGFGSPEEDPAGFAERLADGVRDAMNAVNEVIYELGGNPHAIRAGERHAAIRDEFAGRRSEIADLRNRVQVAAARADRLEANDRFTRGMLDELAATLGCATPAHLPHLVEAARALRRRAAPAASAPPRRPEPRTYRRRETTARAARFEDPAAPPEGVVLDADAAGWHVVTTQGARVPVRPGEWVVAEPDGSGHYPIDDAMFRHLYHPEPEEGGDGQD